jgi:hypothetical protein
MFALYAGALIVLPLAIPPFMKFVIISTFTFVVCYILYEFIIRRVGFLRPLFGLKWQFRKKGTQKIQGNRISTNHGLK